MAFAGFELEVKFNLINMYMLIIWYWYWVLGDAHVIYLGLSKL